MKKQLLLLPLLLIASLFMAFYVLDVKAQAPSAAAPAAAKPAEGKPRTLAAPGCSGFYGSMKATNWPGGKLTLTCPGKNRQRGDCVGASKEIAPGEGFSFNNCNCLDPKSKCLTVSNLPPGCKVKSKLACASNRETVDGTFQVECSEPCPSGTHRREPEPSDAAPSDILPSDILPSGASPVVEPSFVCLILGADGRCLEPTAEPGAAAGGADSPCVADEPSTAVPSDASAPNDTFPSDVVVPTDITAPTDFFPSDAAPSDGFGQTP